MYTQCSEETNPSLAIQYHLYEHPLYRHSTSDEDKINVLVIGFGNYGQEFFDVCLQNAQMLGKKLNVTVVSDDITDKDIYLAERPELIDFFNIDGLLAGQDDIYGDIVFEITKLERENQVANSNILQNIMYEHCDSKHLHYVFIALGEDVLNYAVASACQTAVKVFDIECTVSYICESHLNLADSDAISIPLYVNKDIKKSSLYTEIERMAFNTHLIWEKNLNVDYSTVRASFRKNYNHTACIF